jgi:hypothetical protein
MPIVTSSQVTMHPFTAVVGLFRPIFVARKERREEREWRDTVRPRTNQPLPRNAVEWDEYIADYVAATERMRVRRQRKQS